MNGSLDTSVLVQLVTVQTPDLAQKATKLVESSNKQIAIADMAIIELVFVLERVKQLPRSVIRQAIDGLASMKQFNFNRVMFNQALQIYVDHPALSIQDCCLSVYATLNNAEPLWTFDKKLANQVPNAEQVT